MSSPRPDVEIAGYTVATRFGRVYLVDQQPDSDPGMTVEQARALAAALTEAADRAKRPGKEVNR